MSSFSSFVRGVRAVVVVAALATTAGCAGSDGDFGGAAGTDEQAAKADALKMPSPIVAFENQKMWGHHHLQWHTERHWDLLDPQDLDWAKKHGYARAAIQEGAPGNGFEFLVMHRAMIQILEEKFPHDATLFAGWDKVPTDPRDASNPLPNASTTPFDADMAKAIDRLQNHIDSFASDDELGLFIETKLRPTKTDPANKSSDKTTGIHNYMHNRFADASSAIDIGDPSVNLQNKMFWRLHGFIDARWTAFRVSKKLDDSDPNYVAAIKASKDMMLAGMKMSATEGGGDPPMSLRKFFERE